MNLTDLYLLFSRFVPIKALNKNHIKTASKDKFLDAFQILVLETPSNDRIDTISDYLFLGDQDFVLERLKNSKGQLFFVDSDKIDYLPNNDTGCRMTLGLTIAEHYNQSNTSVVSEMVVQNRCLMTLKHILNTIITDADNKVCELGIEFTQPIEIRFLDMKNLNGMIGYTAFLTLISNTYD